LQPKADAETRSEVDNLHGSVGAGEGKANASFAKQRRFQKGPLIQKALEIFKGQVVDVRG
jgi:hypothetical protein